MGSDVVSGWVLYLVWIIEAGIIVGFASIVPYRRIARIPFCETCGQWLEEVEPVILFEPPDDPMAMRSSLENGEFSVLGSIQPVSEMPSRTPNSS